MVVHECLQQKKSSPTKIQYANTIFKTEHKLITLQTDCVLYLMINCVVER